MNIAITGATGFIGRSLIPTLLARGHHCTIISRNPHRAARCGFAAGVQFLDLADALHKFPEVDAVIHLAGENLAGLWTSRKRRAILSSRVDGTRALVAAMAHAANPPNVFLCASAIGVYGSRPGEILDEESTPDLSKSFRSEVCMEWEHAANEAAHFGARVVPLRIGNVMAQTEGYFAHLGRLFSVGLGFVHGAPANRISWIALEDCVRLICFALECDRIRGPLNVVAPHPITQRTLAVTLADLHQRKLRGTLPPRLLRLVLGELASALIDDQDVRPRRVLAEGFVYQYPAWRPWVDSLEQPAQAATAHSPQLQPAHA